MSSTQLTPLEPGHRIQLPADWADALGLRGQVALVRTSQGILVRPCPQPTWDDFFATKLTVGPAPADQDKEDLEVTGDDLLF
jgi:hypothetical protein